MKPILFICTVVLLLAGCSAPKPILYPNDHYRQVSAETAESDIQTCMTLAEEAGASPSQGKTAQTATGTIAGGGSGIGSRSGRGGNSGTSRTRRHGGRGQWRNRGLSSRSV